MVMVKKRKQESKKKMWVTNTQLKNKANTNNIKKKQHHRSNDQITFRAILTNIVAFKFARSTIHARSTV